MSRFVAVLLCSTALFPSTATAALAWGASGHRMISQLAAEMLPDTLPGFLRTEDAALEIGELGREPDRSKGAGKTHDMERNPGHYLDLDDDEKVFGTLTLAQLPDTREAFDTALRAGAAKKDQYQAGYLPYSIIDGYEQLKEDFAFWRVLAAAEANAKTPEERSRYTLDRQLRETLIIRDLGVWSHFVGDASQPLHVSIHSDGFAAGDANPHNFPLKGRGIHAKFEGAYVHDNITPALIKAKVPAPSSETDLVKMLDAYLDATYQKITPLYEMDADSKFDTANDAAADFVATQLGAAVGELRDMIVLAWNASATEDVGYPTTNESKVKAGEDPLGSMFGLD